MAELLVFKSAIGRSFLVTVVLALALGPVLVAISVWQGHTSASALPGLFLFMAFPAILIYVLYRATEYRITDTALEVRGGIVNATVPLSEIRTVRATRSIMSAPAFSFDRMEIGYDGYNSVIISPDDKAAFIAALERRAPRVSFEGFDDLRRRAG
jgi:hypothetical protein